MGDCQLKNPLKDKTGLTLFVNPVFIIVANPDVLLIRASRISR
jgi:ABC-type Fe3+-hydroxamate transport system substrate-binding protein